MNKTIKQQHSHPGEQKKKKKKKRLANSKQDKWGPTPTSYQAETEGKRDQR